MMLPLLAVVAGAATAGLSVARGRRPMVDLRQLMGDVDLEEAPVGEFQRRLAEPFHLRVVRAAGVRLFSAVTRLTPRQHLEAVKRRLVQAGREGDRAEEFVARQAGLAVGLAVAGGLYLAVSQASGRLAAAIVILLPAAGYMLPAARLNRHVSERQERIRRDLPDTLDLLAISVEAGLGFEGALDVVSHHFVSPLAEEFSRTLREMELGVPRREAFQHLRRRTDVPELSNFIVALLQADALGIAIGRVLKTQGVEMRAQRRMWARERAGKLPVKILFPLVAFIFPPIMVVVMGPAAAGLMKGLR